VAGKIQIVDSVYFKLDRDIILERSFDLLNNVAEVMNAHPEIKQFRVEGHTDDQGGDDYNLNLSERRAKMVVKYLISKGVAPERLVAKGYGESRPIDTNKTKEGRANNRRVEFHVVGAEEKDDIKNSGNKAGTDTLEKE